MNRTKLWRGLTAVFGILLTVSIFLTVLCFKWSGQINYALNVEIPTVAATDDTTYYKSDYGLTAAGLASMLADSDKHDIRTMEEGAVLLKNANAALPLKSTERSVSLFGRAVADPVYAGNSGGPSSGGARQISLHKALTDAGFSINGTLFNAYANSLTKREKFAVENAQGNKSKIGEEPSSFYTSALQNSYASSYNQAAIIMFSRDGGEGRDLFYEDADGISQLALHQEESDLLKMVKSSGKFEKTIVLINSPWPMELGWLDDAQYGVDSALWIGGPGLLGFKGVANILTGAADPSGRLVDTYAANSLSSAAVQNAFDFKFAGSNTNYIVEAEGIYWGYKYYETRYQDQVLNQNNAANTKGAFASASGWNYAEEIVYPFGYGTSYAAFTQELKSLTWNRTTHKVTASVEVTNNGVPSNSAYTGKSSCAVQLYVQLPYESGQAEKSAIQLIDFEKTPLLAKNEKYTVNFEVDDYIFATYDQNTTNGADSTKKGCYVFDTGDYYFAIGSDAHDALNNVLAAREKTGMFSHDGTPVAGDENKAKKETLTILDKTTYARSQYTNNVVSNLLDKADINYWYDNDVVTYMTRDDWTTFPDPVSGLTLNSAMTAELNRTYSKPANAPAFDSFTQGADVTLKMVEMRDVAWDDPKWETFLNQLTISEMCSVIGENFGQPAVKSVGKPANANSDGPGGAQGSYRQAYGGGASTLHVNEIVAAATFSKEILAERGKFIAEDCMFVGTTQLWSPGANLHRTPFSGRNFEYYSEDGVMSYICSAVQCEAMQAKGLNAAIKHFAGNDQETNRSGLCVFVSEQAARQNFLKGFEGAFTEGGALGTMMSCSVIGLGKNDIYDNTEVLTGIMRREWGFKGITITDSVAGATNFPTVACLVAGTDTFNARSACGNDVQKYLLQNKDGNVLKALREANKRFFYSVSRSTLINGLTPDTVIQDFMPWWQPVLIVIVCFIGLLMLASAFMFVFGTYFYPKLKKQSRTNRQRSS